MENQLHDTTIAVVTGATGGMGAATAKQMAEAGWKSLLICDMDQGRLDEQAGKLAGTGAEVIALAGDMADPGWPEKLIAALRGREIGALVHTAGLSPNMAGPERVLQVNLDATARLVDAALPHMARGSAAILYASNSSYMPISPEGEEAFEQPLPPELSAGLLHLAPRPEVAYPLSKRGVRALARHKARAFGDQGARLLSLSPGAIDTAMMRLELENSERARMMIERAALARLGQADEVAAVTVFLASPAASYITGCDILVDGGQLAGLGLGGRR